MEAITSRPLLLAAAGKMTEHGGQTRVLLSVTHAAAAHVKALVVNVRAGLQHILTTAPQLPSALRWRALVNQQGRPQIAVADTGGRTGAEGHPGQFHRAGTNRHQPVVDRRPAARYARCRRRHHHQAPDSGRLRPARGHCRDFRVPRVGRGEKHLWPGNRGRWRLHHRVGASVVRQTD